MLLEQPADILDVATQAEIRATEAAVQAALQATEKNLPATGLCHYCHEPVVADSRFCDEFCRDDYEYLKERRKANGR